MPALLDTFTGSGVLGKLEQGGFMWNPDSGTWSRSGGFAATASAPSTNPIATVDAKNPNVSINLNPFNGYGGGDAIYFRVSDASNWWRLRIRYYSSTVQTGTYNTGMYDIGAYVQVVNNQPTAGTQFEGYAAGAYYLAYVPAWPSGNQQDVDKISVNAAHYYSRWQAPYSAHYEPSYTTYYYYVFYLDKCVAGTVTNVKASSSYSLFSAPKMRVDASGSLITCYWYSNTTQQGTFNATDTFNQFATKHGVGKGGSDSSSYQSGIDNFTLDYIGNKAFIYDGASEVPAVMTVYDGAAEQSVSLSIQAA